MAWLDELLRGTGGAVSAPGFPLLPQEQFDEAQQAEEARQAAAARLARLTRGSQRSSGPGEMQGQEPVPFSMGMLSPYGVNWPASSGETGLASMAGASGPVSTGQPPVAQDMPPSTNDPMSREPVLFQNGVPLPRPRPAGLGAEPEQPSPMSLAPPDQSARAEGVLPPNATPTAGTAPPGIPAAPAAASSGGIMDAAGGILGKIFNPANAPLLLAMGGGFAGAPSLGTGMSRAFSAAAPQAALLRKEQVTQTTMAETYRALVARGVPPQEAIAAVRSPEIMKALVAKHFETKPLTVHNVKGPLGDETPLVFNPTTGRFSDMSGNQISGSSAAGGGVGGMSGLLAEGVTYDPNATGEAYFNQFGKDVQAAARAYLNGDTIPTGNPRQRTISNFAKTVAQRYAQDMGIPFNDASYAQKRNLIADYGRGTPVSLGGQRNSGGTAMGHLETLGRQLVDLNNVSLPGGVLPTVAGWINWARQNGTEEQKARANAVNNTLDRYVAEVGKYYAGSTGGGVHEREAARQRFNTVKTGPELAAAVSAERELFHSKLMQLQEQADSVLGDQRQRLVGDILQPHAKAAYEKLQGHIDRLNGKPPGAAPTPAARPAAPTAAPAPGNYVLDPATGRLVPQQ